MTFNTTLLRSSRLRQSLLKQAFEGKLVPKNPSDEPASALLKRIQKERAEAETNGKPKKRTAKKKRGKVAQK